MAIYASRIKTGTSWIMEALALFKKSPRACLLLAIAYLGIFVLLPSTPGLQVFAFLTILAWPIFIAVAMRFYRNIEFNKAEKVGDIMQLIQPNIRLLLLLGAINLLYFIVVSLVMSTEIQGLADVIDRQAQLTEQEMMIAMQKMMPIFFKLALFFTPLMMISWFSPMLIAFNEYSLAKAIKSSLAASLQYMLALAVAWLLLCVSMALFMILASVVVGILGLILSSFAQPLMSLVVFSGFLVSIVLTLAFQYVSYRDIYKTA